MDFSVALANLLNPPVLFFFLGIIAVFLRSDLEIPAPLPKFFSLYLLMSIGFKGGVELSKSGWGGQVGVTLAAAIGLALIVPVYTFFILRWKLDAPNAAAVAATYGSISAVTFIAGTSFLARLNVPYGGHMVAAMALMESPAIVVGVVLARLGAGTGQRMNWSALGREAFFNGSVLLLLGSLVIGLLTGEAGGKALAPFTSDLFKGMLCVFLLDLGLVCGRRLPGVARLGAFPVAFALIIPLINAAASIGIARWLGLNPGDALLLTILGASASYIAVPAAMRLALPEADPGLYVTLALAVTFPLNIIVGIPLYQSIIARLWQH